MGCHSLLQGIFLTQRSNLGLSNCRQILYHLSHQGSPLQLVLKGAIVYTTKRFFELMNNLFKQRCFPAHNLTAPGQPGILEGILDHCFL